MDVIHIPEKKEDLCPICYEAKEDLRTLPCWHIGCITCILGMTQAGEGKSVTCHMCRQPCLFENIRSLPRAVKCGVCDSFVTNPIRFPCCTNLICSECARKKANGGNVACQNFCSYNLYKVEDLPLARLCSTCFALHTTHPPNCGHVFCPNCLQENIGEGKRCPVCVAISTPRPEPTDPFNRTVPGQGEAFATIQMIRMLQQRRLVHTQQRNLHHEELANVIEMHMKNDLIKGFAFLLIMAITSYFSGLSLQSWALGIFTMLILRPSLICTSLACALVNIVLLFVSLYYYFWDSVTLICVDTLSAIVLREIEKMPSNRFVYPVLAWIIFLITFIAIILFFPVIFVHRMVLAIVIQALAKLGNSQ